MRKMMMFVLMGVVVYGCSASEGGEVRPFKLFDVLPGDDAQKTHYPRIVIPSMAVRTKEGNVGMSPIIDVVLFWMGPGGVPYMYKGRDGRTEDLVGGGRDLYGKFVWTPQTGQFTFHGTPPGTTGKIPLNMAIKFRYTDSGGRVTIYDQAYRLFNISKHPETGQFIFSMNSLELQLESQSEGPTIVPKK